MSRVEEPGPWWSAPSRRPGQTARRAAPPGRRAAVSSPDDGANAGAAAARRGPDAPREHDEPVPANTKLPLPVVAASCGPSRATTDPLDGAATEHEEPGWPGR